MHHYTIGITSPQETDDEHIHHAAICFSLTNIKFPSGPQVHEELLGDIMPQLLADHAKILRLELLDTSTAWGP